MRRTPATRTAATAATALALALAATACGDGGTTGPASDGEFSGQTITVAGVWTGTEQKNFQKVLDAWSEESGASVEFLSTGDNVSTVIGSKIEGGDAPEVVMVPQVGVLKQFAQSGWLSPLSADAEQEVTQNFANVWKDYGTVGGKYYGLYFKAAHKSLVWYSPDALEQAGVDEPATYAQMLENGRTISDSGLPAFSVAGQDGWTLTDWFENVYLSQAGPEKYDQLADHAIPWTDPSVVEALTTLGELFSDKELVAGGADTALRTDFPTSVQHVFGPEPKAAMVYEGDFVGALVAGDFGKTLGEDARFFLFPPVDGGPKPVVSGGDAAVVLKDGEHQEAAMSLIEFLATPEAAAVWAKAGGYLSPNRELDVSAYADDLTRQTAQSLVEAGDSVRFDMSDQAPAAFGGTVGKGEWKLLQDFLRDPSDPKATAEQLEAAAADAFDR
ncbi:carbohydrate ABC transporter substrate-binding protein [Streptomyces sp. JJ66]|uniref:ABC transporter substrate-binding protein n=1 Tax=Streptomyces sp. JJ66 TaxID=2803843 RepID=UPI001C595D6C|nr:ABC transporter substrate-binding protein [Streptomyces sp. JJ66]MBW1603374.1 carbohydrate ABC transporter substrate-binding protein [Streptomyces sp. JJ66]